MSHPDNPTTKFCLPIQKTSSQAVEQTIEAGLGSGLFDYFEVWLDLVEEDESVVVALAARLAERLGERLVLLFRRPNLEPPRMGPGARRKVMAGLSGAATLLDLDVTSQMDEIRTIAERRWQIPTILSHHDYVFTPSLGVLRESVGVMTANHATICKVATRCHTDEDAITLMRLLVEMKRAGLRYIVAGMGVPGRITRLYGAIQGNAMNFAPLDPEAGSAPDQLTRRELSAIVAILQGRAPS